MRRLPCLAVVCLGLLAAPVGAQVPERAFAWVPADTALFLHVRPVDLAKTPLAAALDARAPLRERLRAAPGLGWGDFETASFAFLPASAGHVLRVAPPVVAQAIDPFAA